jgi:hypothetical protein
LEGAAKRMRKKKKRKRKRKRSVCYLVNMLANTCHGDHESSPHHTTTVSPNPPSTRTWTTPATLDSEGAVVRAMQQAG